MPKRTDDVLAELGRFETSLPLSSEIRERKQTFIAALAAGAGDSMGNKEIHSRMRLYIISTVAETQRNLSDENKWDNLGAQTKYFLTEHLDPIKVLYPPEA